MSEGNPYREDDASALAGELFDGKFGVAEALERLRTRLLDLTMRNRLLNYKHPKGRSFQFANDPDLDLLYERLEEGRTVSLAYVSDPLPSIYEGSKKPDVRIHARELGINTSFDIAPASAPSAYRRLASLQTLLYPADLEKLVRKVSTEARTVVEETGTNMLYLMFGFLEYFDSDDSDKPVLAPLLSMPVSLARGTLDNDSRTYLYDVTYSGQDIAENFTLREKFKQQFTLQLPELGEEDTPEMYFTKVQEAVSKRSRWAVRRRLSLGFLSFGKLAIWADLDPAKSENLLSSELLKDIFEGGRAQGSEAFHAEDYVIDSHPDAELPLIYDADSSQHSAIIDVKNGKSLVINGPPGTGKSQTITNIVASAIAVGKKVLFVSEKAAALEVVKQRLESAGLGDFCLELHSHKTQKKHLLENIEQRMNRTFSAPSGYKNRIELLRERRNTLNAYAQLLGSRIGNRLDLTVHEVFWAMERRRLDIGEEVDAILGLSLLASDWSSDQVDKRRVVLGDAAGALEALGCSPLESPWVGYSPRLLVRGDELPILRVVEKALAHAQAVQRHADDVGRIFCVGPWSLVDIESAAGGITALSAIPQGIELDLLEHLFRAGLASVSTVSGEAQRLATVLAKIRGLHQRADAALLTRSVDQAERLATIAGNADQRLDGAAMLLTVTELSGRMSQLATALDAIEVKVGQRNVRVTADPRALRTKLETMSRYVEGSALMRQPAQLLDASSRSAVRIAYEVKGSLSYIEEVLAASRVPFNGQVDELHALIDGRGMPELLPESSHDGEVLAELRTLATGGWHDWTAERLASKSREIGEQLTAASLAAQELAAFFARASVPFEATPIGLEGAELLLTVAASAPQDLLPYRSPGLEHPEFADIAIRAEEAHKSISHRGSKIAGAFHLDTLPDDDMLRAHVGVLRRETGMFKILKAEWRQARAAFQSCTREQRKLTPQVMAEQFSAALAWRTAREEFVSNKQFQSVLGTLFDGVQTDFGKVRRLHGWVRASTATLLPTDYAQHLNLNRLPDQQIAHLHASAGRIRTWISKLSQLSQAVGTLPGLDPALVSARRVEDLFPPLTEYAKALASAATLLRKVVRPTASVGRAVELVELSRRIAEHRDVLVTLVQAPNQLSKAGALIGLSDSPLSYHDLRVGISSVDSKAKRIGELAEQISQALGETETPDTALEVLGALEVVNASSERLVHLGGDYSPRTMRELVSLRKEQVQAGQSLAEFLSPCIKPEALVRDGLESVRAAVDAAREQASLDADLRFAQVFGDHMSGLDTDEAAIARCLEWAGKVASVADRLPAGAADALLRPVVASEVGTIVQVIAKANASLAAYTAEMTSLEPWGHLDLEAWGGRPMPADAVARLERAKGGATALITWSKYLASRDDAQALDVGELVQRVEEGSLSASSLVAAFDYVFYRSLARGIISSHRELARFTGGRHEELRAEFARMDKELIALNGAMYASNVDGAKKPIRGISAGRAGDLTEMSLLTKEIKKQKRHIPIRQLLKRAGKSLQELKPCFMMGPLSVAQYLEQGHLSFDLVVMDEASQLRPEDALGALARGKQLVVVGDPKQLPPTNFFDKLMENDDESPEDTPAVVDGVESILGICEHLYRPVRTLRWHYRSRHESLIAFSNSQFYDGRLVVFPSPYKRNSRLGVNYRYVKGGIYKDRRNVPEAERVVDAIVEHMLTCPEESLGVVTLNQTQRELIEDLLDKRVRDVAAVAKYLERHKKDGWEFFVKNLENVQGDERDVIFVSTTFGRPPDGGVVRQFFGPINSNDGWRRLNVLFTRARRRLDLYTSMLPSDVRLEGKVPLGRRALRDYLEYAKSGQLPPGPSNVSDREPDSDFEVSVAEALRQNGYEAQPQIGVAGYFVDIGIRHPERKGEFLAGIECDGVTYHSSLSARDRDRIRQEVLENLGWKGRIVRVWSSDWFADPVGQTRRLVHFLEGRRDNDANQPAPYSDEELTAGLEVLEEVGGDDVGVQEAKTELPADESVTPEAAHRTQEQEVDPLFVELGDRVTYRTLDEPLETHTVQIVDSASNARLRLVNEATPLAQALLGLCADDVSEIQVGGQPGRRIVILKITRDS
jgi:hypothetical protein